MIAIMYDGLELGKFYRDDTNILRLKLNNGVKRSWLPYIFDIGLEHNMEKVLNTWIKERIFPKNRLGSRKMLRELGLKRYDVAKIAEITRCSLITDPYWIVYKEDDTYSKNSVRGQLGEKTHPYNSLNISNEEQFIWRK